MNPLLKLATLLLLAAIVLYVIPPPRDGKCDQFEVGGHVKVKAGGNAGRSGRVLAITKMNGFCFYRVESKTSDGTPWQDWYQADDIK